MVFLSALNLIESFLLKMGFQICFYMKMKFNTTNVTLFMMIAKYVDDITDSNDDMLYTIIVLLVNDITSYLN
jgi:hypothetical protein